MPTPVNVGGLFIPSGSTIGLFVTTDGTTVGAINYTNGTSSFSNGDLTIFSGGETSVPFVDTAAADRIWNGTIPYTLGPGTAAPGPSSLALVGLGVAGLVVRRRRTKA